MIDIIGFLGRPRRHIHREILSKNDRLSIEHVRSSGNRHANTVDLQAVQSFQAVIYDTVVLPANQPVSCRSVEKIVFTRALPYEVPRILRIDSDRTAPVSINCAKLTSEIFLKVCLTVGYGEPVGASFRRRSEEH